jgi:predicted GIY-YIG superfamily endonuclease
MVHIYVLKLKSGKYYIGRTTKPSARIKAHWNGRATSWTSKYRPEKIVSISPGDNFDEDKTVLEYMSKYGIDNVRGGSFSNMKLGKSEKKILGNMVYGAQNRCFHCGSRGHWVRDCPVPNSIKYRLD